MTPKEKAAELIEKFKDYVHGYVGSSMLTNHEYHEQILSQAKKVALLCVEEIMNDYVSLDKDLINWLYKSEKVVYWQQVKTEIENYQP